MDNSPKLSKEQLRQRLRQKINAKKMVKKPTKNQMTQGRDDYVNNLTRNQRIMFEVAELANESKRLKNKPLLVRNKMLAPKYKWLVDNYPMIYKTTIRGEINMSIMSQMVEQRSKITDDASLQQSSKNVGRILVKELGIDEAELERKIKEKNEQ